MHMPVRPGNDIPTAAPRVRAAWYASAVAVVLAVIVIGGLL